MMEPLGEVAARVVETARAAMNGVERITIESRAQWLALRASDVTASAAAALLGAHPYLTAYGLWAEKTGLVPPDGEMSEAMERGLELEPLARRWIVRKNPTWRVEEPGAYYRDPAVRLGATPDAFAFDPARPGRGVIQIKSVEPSAFRRNWRNESGEIEPPLYAVIQAMVEAELTAASWAAVAALVVGHGIALHIVEVPRHDGILTRLRAEVADFWRTIDEGRAPEPDWKRDGGLIEALYQPTGEVIDLAADNSLPSLCDERERLSGEKSVAEARLKEIKAEILTRLAGASMARISDGRVITANRVNRKAYEVKASSFVDVRVKAGKPMEIAS